MAFVLYHEAKKDMSQDFQNFLQSPFVKTVFGELRIHPESQFFIGLAKSIGELTAAKVHRAAWGAVFLSLFPLVEGIGLLFRVSWAGWLAIGESAFFIPIEFYEMLNQELANPDKFPWSIFVVTIINIIIVWYLYDNREVLFRHHHPIIAVREAVHEAVSRGGYLPPRGADDGKNFVLRLAGVTGRRRGPRRSRVRACVGVCRSRRGG